MRRDTRLDAWRCERGHVHLHGGALCHACARPLRPVRVAADARLLAATTVHVNPGGRPFVLGVAVTRCGRARTLCVVEGALRKNGRDAIRLRNENGVIVARAAGVRGHSPARFPTREGSQKS